LRESASAVLAAIAMMAIALISCPALSAVSRTLTFSDCPYAETPLPRDYGSDKEVSLSWRTQGQSSPLIASTGASPFPDRSPDATNRFLVAQGTSLIEFEPTVRLTRVFVRDNEPDFLDRSASGLTVTGELEENTVFTATVDFVPQSNSGTWIEVNGEGAIDTLRFISHSDLTKSYLIDDLEFEIYSETEVIALAGLNQSAREGTIVTLDGGGSVNADSFSWAQIKTGEEPDVTLTSPDRAVTTFVAPAVSTATVLTFELAASGPLGFDTDRTEVTVHISTAPATPPRGLSVLPREWNESIGAVLEWEAHPDATRYVVFRAEGHPQGDYVKVAPSISTAFYEDEWLEEGMIYFYEVAAANEFGVSPASQPVGLVASRNLAFDADAVPGARVMNPTGSGLRNIEAIRNGMVEESYDSYHGGVTESEDWYGYFWNEPRYFDTVVYYEGQNFPDGGWWTALTVEYTTDGTNWRQAERLSISPPYNFEDTQEGRSPYTRFQLTFARCQGIGIRIHGEPGGAADFTSVAELEVYGDQAPNIVVADAGPDLCEEEGERITLHGENSLHAEEYFWEQIRVGNEPEVILNGADTPNPSFLVEEVSTNTVFTFRLTVMGFHGPKSDTVKVTVVNKGSPDATEGLSATGGDRRVELSWQANHEATSYKLFRSSVAGEDGSLLAGGITETSYVDAEPDLRPFRTYYYRVVGVNDYGEGPPSEEASATPIENFAMYPDAEPLARVMNPTGSGQKDLHVIHNGIVQEKGYDSFDGANPAEEDWYGYVWSDAIYPDTVVYTMGKNYLDGGWWTFLTVQYMTEGGSWREAANVTITPPYNFEDSYTARLDYSRYTLTFDRVRTSGIRIYGEPGGIVDFTSIVELEVYGLDAPIACRRDILPLSFTPGETATVNLRVEMRQPQDVDSLTITETVPDGAFLVDAGGGNTAVPGTITWSFGPGEVRETEVSYTIGIFPDLSKKLSFRGTLSYGEISNQLIRGEDSLYPEPVPPKNARLEMTLVGHLRWSPVLEEGIVGYHVYRSVNGGPYADISGLINQTFFDDLGVAAGASYRYKVTAQSASGVESELAESVAVGPASVRMGQAEFEDYNYAGGLFPGGEGRTGIAASNSDDLSAGKDYFFHDSTASNAYRPGDSVDIQGFVDGGYFIRGATEGDWWRYSLDLPEAGLVKIADLRVSSSQEATYEFLWDETSMGRFSFHTAGEDNWRTYQMDIPTFWSPSGVHTLRIRVVSGVSNADSFGIGLGWSPSRRKLIFAEDFDRYATTQEVEALGEWTIVNGSAEPEGAWRLWSTSGPKLAEDQPGPQFPGFSSGYMVSNGDFAGSAQLDEQLISPAIDCTFNVCVAVEFIGAINIYEQDQDGDLQTTDLDISTYDEGSQTWSEWVNLYRHDRTGGDDFSAIPKWFDVSLLADGKKVRFRWHFYNTRNDYWWAIDGVKVSGESRSPRVISAMVEAGGSVTLSWESFGQGLYTVEFCDSLADGLWQPIPGTEWPVTETVWQGDDVSSTGARFYRVRSE
jgi:hypothetical protein